jgi:hypothetical protein
MTLYAFKGPGRVFGFSTNPQGANLPKNFPWEPFKTIELDRGVEVPGVHIDECLDDVERYGFHLTEAHRRITDAYV